MPISEGLLAEDFARRIAGDLGVPDFVYHPQPNVRTGSGSRERGDGFLIAGSDGLILQVKHRDRAIGMRDTPARAKLWCEKYGLKAEEQGWGTRRLAKSSGLVVTSLRGYTRTLQTIDDWPIVVILDHPRNPSVTFGASPNTLFLSLTDWQQLHSLVRSTAGLINYVRRALTSGVKVPLGAESGRYQNLAKADAVYASPSPTMVPILPSRPLHPKDRRYADLFDDLITKVADPDGATGWDEEQYLWIVEHLDRTPVLVRARLGAKMEQTFLSMIQHQARRSFFQMDRESGARFAFLYDYDSGEPDGEYFPDGEFIAPKIAAYGALRQHQALEAGCPPESATLAVGVLHNPTRGRRYQFAFFQGAPPDLPEDLRSQLQEEYGIFDGTTIRPPPPEVGAT